jgi:mono/diheme cytochrome c family protein
MLVLFAMPWIGRSRAGHVFNVGLLVVLLGGAALLTAQAMYDDNYAAWTSKTKNGEPWDKSEKSLARFEASTRFLDAKKQAVHEAERVAELAMMPERIPPTGALAMSYDDPLLQGPRLFKQYCAGCHNYESETVGASNIVNAKPTAPNLAGLGTRAWIAAWLDEDGIKSAHNFGYEGSPFAEGDMVTFVTDMVADDAKDADKSAAKEAVSKVVAALVDAADLPGSREPDETERTQIDAGWELINGGLAEVVDGGMSCTDCHSFEAGEAAGAPNLHAYMSRQWLVDFIKNPAAEQFYGERNDRMPAFAAHNDPRLNQLDDKSLGLIVDWLRGDWRRPAAEGEAGEGN